MIEMMPQFMTPLPDEDNITGDALSMTANHDDDEQVHATEGYEQQVLKLLQSDPNKLYMPIMHFKPDMDTIRKA